MSTEHDEDRKRVEEIRKNRFRGIETQELLAIIDRMSVVSRDDVERGAGDMVRAILDGPKEICWADAFADGLRAIGFEVKDDA